VANSALITGVTGQDAAYLAKLLLEKGYKVIGGYRHSEVPTTMRLDELGITGDIELAPIELSEPYNILRLLEVHQPDEVYNLAAQSAIDIAYEQPIYTSDVDAIAVTRILEAIRTVNPKIKMYQASSSAMFDTSVEFQDEQTSFRPISPYAISKAYAHQMCAYYRQVFNIPVSCGIAFNHESPLRGHEFVTRKITATVASGEPLLLGNTSMKRDFGFAGDYVEAMHLMLQAEPDDYVIATGKATSIQEFVDHCSEYIGREIEVGKDPRFYRPAEAGNLRGNASKIKEKLGWEPKVDTRGLAHMMMEADLRLYSHKVRSNT
jgi:GDPmannose 4,6-dehydratase